MPIPETRPFGSFGCSFSLHTHTQTHTHTDTHTHTTVGPAEPASERPRSRSAYKNCRTETKRWPRRRRRRRLVVPPPVRLFDLILSLGGCHAGRNTATNQTTDTMSQPVVPGQQLRPANSQQQQQHARSCDGHGSKTTKKTRK